MKINSVVQQLFINQVYQVPALAVALLLSAQLTPAIAQENTTLSPNGNSSNTGATTNSSSSGNSNFSVSETDYTLGAGDQIRLDIFQVAEYSGEYPVLVDGTISLPLVGRVNVSGLTLKETSELVSEKYKLYLKRPVVTVGLLAPRPLKIGVSGEVDNPGSYEFALSTENNKFPSVTDMIEQAGGITTLADVRNVQVKRTIQGRETTFNSDLWALLTQGRLNQDISLRDGDTIFIPTVAEINSDELNRLSQASFGLQTDQPIKVAVVGEIYRPGSYTVQPEKLANNSNTQSAKEGSVPPRLTQAIGVAGGIKPLANVKEVQVKRKAWDGTEKLIAVDLWSLIQEGSSGQDVILQEGDTIVIPQAEQLAAEDSEQLAAASFSPGAIKVNVVGEVATPGPVEVPPNTPLNQAILAAGGFNNQRAKTGNVELVRLNPNGTVTKRQIQVDFASGINDENNPTLRNNDVVVVSRSGLAKVGDTAGSIFNPIGGALGVLRFMFGF
ncbi:SLBB domain-containing protein [Stanieria cyanosphaera]|nr:SLBB domain-containing protein [Stanieria cyanosphaera]